MAKEEAIELEGTVTEVLPDATFKVLVSNGHDVHATIAGKMRRFRIRVLAGDRVTTRSLAVRFDARPNNLPAQELVPLQLVRSPKLL